MVQFDTTIHQVFASKAKYFRLEGTWSDEYISKKFEDFFCSFEVKSCCNYPQSVSGSSLHDYLKELNNKNILKLFLQSIKKIKES